MTILIAMPNRDPQPLVGAIQQTAPDIRVCIWPEIGDPERISMAVLWQHPEQLAESLPNLQAVHSYGAGVEHIINDRTLPVDMPIARVSGPRLSASMVDYLFHRVSSVKAGITAGEIKIGILGYGQLGRAVASAFLQQGFQVMTWRRRREVSDEVAVFAGDQGLTEMLGQTDILICLLPLTPATVNIIRRTTLAACKPGLYLINVGRGAHVVEPDLLEAIDAGLLSGACLDVTRNEPLPENDPLAHHPAVVLTHHTASLTDPNEAAAVIVENYRRLSSGKPLNFAVNRQYGY